MERYDEQQFRAKIDAALGRIRTLLENTRNPQYPADVPHAYDDKYLLAEHLTQVTVAALLQCLEVAGLSEEGRATLREWAEKRSVTLRLEAKEECRFLREEVRTIDSPEVVTETRGFFGKDKITSKVVTKVTDYFWSFDVTYSLMAYQGNEPDKPLSLLSRSGSVEIKTGAKTTPRPRSVARPGADVNVTWLFAHLDAEARPSFAIDRTAKACHTPRRNPETDAALRALEELYAWCGRVVAYFLGDLFPAQQEHGRDLASLHADDVFVPVVPLFEAEHGETRPGGTEPAGGVLPPSFAGAFLAEERRTLVEKCRALSATFPSDGSLITAVEGGLLVTLLHAREVCQQLAFAVDAIEDMLRQQLIAAIGKVVTPDDFNAYMEYHHRKLFKAEYRPKPFSYAIRRPEHYPEGVLAVEAERGAAMPDPISTTVACSVARQPMSFALDAATRVSFLGERYLHAWISHAFSGQSGLSLSLVARARQFSSFILLVGRIASADVFEPRHAIIVQNKDLLTIPLMLEQLPTPKEFRDAIESLSPEQQRFAKAFRGMQLESTLFAVCVIQIKPQLERLLKLEPDSLTKEIKLTQELLSLFIEYQIPSDLLSYDGAPEAEPAQKLARVTEYVGKMFEMIHTSKQRELAEEREREALRLAEANRTVMVATAAPPMSAMALGAGFGPPPPAPGGYGGPPPPSPAAFAPPPQAAPSPSVARTQQLPAPAAAPPPVAKQAPPPARPAASTDATTSTTSAASAASVASTTSAASVASVASAGGASAGDLVDYTKLPALLDKRFEELDEDGALRATILRPGDRWTRSAQKGLLSAPAQASLSAKQQKEEKNRAFDLLDALTKSGALPIEDASLHVVLAATHGFDQTLLETVIQDNVNPIEKVERSLMIVGTTIHGRPAAELLADDQRERFLASSPRLGLTAPATPPAGPAEG